MDIPTNAAPTTAIVDRDDLPRGFLATGWPLLALALLLLMLLRACVPGASPPAAPPFSPADATRQANEDAAAAMRALSPQPAAAEVLAALNLIVVNFPSGSDQVPTDAGAVLQQAAAVIATLPPETRIVITGHTDNVGDAVANRLLSLRRAEAARASLVALGVSPEMLAVDGAGGAQPVADNRSEAGRFRNRRIEFTLAP